MNKPGSQRLYIGIDVGTGSAWAGIFTGGSKAISASKARLKVAEADLTQPVAEDATTIGMEPF